MKAIHITKSQTLLAVLVAMLTFVTSFTAQAAEIQISQPVDGYSQSASENDGGTPSTLFTVFKGGSCEFEFTCNVPDADNTTLYAVKLYDASNDNLDQYGSEIVNSRPNYTNSECGANLNVTQTSLLSSESNYWVALQKVMGQTINVKVSVTSIAEDKVQLVHTIYLNGEALVQTVVVVNNISLNAIKVGAVAVGSSSATSEIVVEDQEVVSTVEASKLRVETTDALKAYAAANATTTTLEASEMAKIKCYLETSNGDIAISNDHVTFSSVSISGNTGVMSVTVGSGSNKLSATISGISVEFITVASLEIIVDDTYTFQRPVISSTKTVPLNTNKVTVYAVTSRGTKAKIPWGSMSGLTYSDVTISNSLDYATFTVSYNGGSTSGSVPNTTGKIKTTAGAIIKLTADVSACTFTRSYCETDAHVLTSDEKSPIVVSIFDTYGDSKVIPTNDPAISFSTIDLSSKKLTVSYATELAEGGSVSYTNIVSLKSPTFVSLNVNLTSGAFMYRTYGQSTFPLDQTLVKSVSVTDAKGNVCDVSSEVTFGEVDATTGTFTASFSALSQTVTSDVTLTLKNPSMSIVSVDASATSIDAVYGATTLTMTDAIKAAIVVTVQDKVTSLNYQALLSDLTFYSVNASTGAFNIDFTGLGNNLRGAGTIKVNPVVFDHLEISMTSGYQISAEYKVSTYQADKSKFTVYLVDANGNKVKLQSLDCDFAPIEVAEGEESATLTVSYTDGEQTCSGSIVVPVDAIDRSQLSLKISPSSSAEIVAIYDTKEYQITPELIAKFNAYILDSKHSKQYSIDAADVTYGTVYQSDDDDTKGTFEVEYDNIKGTASISIDPARLLKLVVTVADDAAVNAVYGQDLIDLETDFVTVQVLDIRSDVYVTIPNESVEFSQVDVETGQFSAKFDGLTATGVITVNQIKEDQLELVATLPEGLSVDAIYGVSELEFPSNRSGIVVRVHVLGTDMYEDLDVNLVAFSKVKVEDGSFTMSYVYRNSITIKGTGTITVVPYDPDELWLSCDASSATLKAQIGKEYIDISEEALANIKVEVHDNKYHATVIDNSLVTFSQVGRDGKFTATYEGMTVEGTLTIDKSHFSRYGLHVSVAEGTTLDAPLGDELLYIDPSVCTVSLLDYVGDTVSELNNDDCTFSNVVVVGRTGTFTVTYDGISGTGEVTINPREIVKVLYITVDPDAVIYAIKGTTKVNLDLSAVTVRMVSETKDIVLGNDSVTFSDVRTSDGYFSAYIWDNEVGGYVVGSSNIKVELIDFDAHSMRIDVDPSVYIEAVYGSIEFTLSTNTLQRINVVGIGDNNVECLLPSYECVFSKVDLEGNFSVYYPAKDLTAYGVIPIHEWEFNGIYVIVQNNASMDVPKGYEYYPIDPSIVRIEAYDASGNRVTLDNADVTFSDVSTKTGKFTASFRDKYGEGTVPNINWIENTEDPGEDPSETPDAVDTPAAEPVTVVASKGVIVVRGTNDFTVYSIAGTCYGRETTLHQGIYLVVTSSRTFKVLVR